MRRSPSRTQNRWECWKPLGLFQDLKGPHGISRAGGGSSSEDYGKSLPALTHSVTALFLLLSPELIISKNYQMAFWMHLRLPMKGKGLGVNSGWSFEDLLYHKRRGPGQGHWEKGKSCRLASRTLSLCIFSISSRFQAARPSPGKGNGGQGWPAWLMSPLGQGQLLQLLS